MLALRVSKDDEERPFEALVFRVSRESPNEDEERP